MVPKGIHYRQRGPTGKGQKSVRKIKKEIKKDKRTKNATFEGPNKNSGVDKRKAINREKRSI